MTRKRILTCVFACCPPGLPGFKGGEDVLGWHLLLQVGKHHDVWAMTPAENRARESYHWDKLGDRLMEIYQRILSHETGA